MLLPRGGQSKKGGPGFGWGCSGAWVRFPAWPGVRSIIQGRTLKESLQRGWYPGSQGLPWGEVATDSPAWPGTSPPPPWELRALFVSLPRARNSLRASDTWLLLILKTRLRSRYYFCLHFRDGESEDQKCQVAWPRSPSQGATEPESKPQEADSRAQSLTPTLLFLPVKPCFYILLHLWLLCIAFHVQARSYTDRAPVHFFFLTTP